MKEISQRAREYAVNDSGWDFRQDEGTIELQGESCMISWPTIKQIRQKHGLKEKV